MLLEALLPAPAIREMALNLQDLDTLKAPTTGVSKSPQVGAEAGRRGRVGGWGVCCLGGGGGGAGSEWVVAIAGR